jgi:hypothetical protein
MPDIEKLLNAATSERAPPKIAGIQVYSRKLFSSYSSAEHSTRRALS